jgi:cytochrome c-type biogenesis protein CcmH/NrfG
VSAHYELGLALGASGQSALAVVALRKAVKLKPDLTHGWLALGDELMSMGDAAGADAAYAWHIKTSTHDPRLMTAAAALCANDIPQAEALLRAHLKQFPTDVGAIRMLAEAGARLGHYDQAETLLARCVELAPGFDAARFNYATILHRQYKATEALAQTDGIVEAQSEESGLSQS